MKEKIYLLDYGAGNVRSVINAISKLGYTVQLIQSPQDFSNADKIIFPGVGAFGNAMERLSAMGVVEALKEYIQQNRPFFGICVGMQCLFNSSEESPTKGLGIVNGQIKRFKSTTKAVPHIGWNGAFVDTMHTHYYFVHSYAAIIAEQDVDLYQEWGHTLTTYGDETFISSIRKGNVIATQFHPEKSGMNGLSLLKEFLKMAPQPQLSKKVFSFPLDALTKRIIACLDVRSNDHGDLVVTKGDQYDVREEGEVRNLGKPVELAERYYLEGSDEVTFLNITSFRSSVVQDQPMLEVLKRTSERVFVPLTIGGGIRDLELQDGTLVKAVEVAGEYFRSGADKVSIGSDAVLITEMVLKGEEVKGNAISDIAEKYGNQAVVISVDPKRVYVAKPSDTTHQTTKTSRIGPNGEEYCWYQCTIKGGRELRDVDVVQLTTTCESLGAGEILLNCMDMDGTNDGYDLELIKMVKQAVTIPVIASSGAGKIEHFEQVFRETACDAALAAGIFHRKEVAIQDIKTNLTFRMRI